MSEARADFLQGIDVPMDEPSDDRKDDGFAAFRRYACKMATGTGKTTVMGMLCAWNILNKVNNRGDARFSDVVLVVCPNVTIRNRLQELDPSHGDASLYRTRDLVPPDKKFMADLARGRVLITNWHVFEPQAMQTGGVSARVSKAGRAMRIRETIKIGAKTTTARGTRYLTMEELNRQEGVGLLAVIERNEDDAGNLKSVVVDSVKYVESDTALVNRILGREIGGKGNILVLNDEAHHAYRIRRPEPDEDEEDDTFGESDEAEEFVKEATVWIDGLDRIHKLRGINYCVDLSATPYYLARVGNDTNRPFPWVVSDFGLTDAIESGLVKVPQFAIRDTAGEELSYYFNVWRWIMGKLTSAEKGGKKSVAKPEAVVKYAHHPIAMLGGLWDAERVAWQDMPDETRPPVFIIVCKNTRLAKVVYEWIAEGNGPPGVPPWKIDSLKNTADRELTIRVDSKVVHETDKGEAKSDASRWMRFTLDTVGKVEWPKDTQSRPIYPEGFEALASKLKRPLHPPGRDVRCIVSVGMLTEGWDCNTVTHIIGLRPFMSQLLCEQVVGRGLRRRSYDLDADEKLPEEVAKIFGVPFEIVPFKENDKGTSKPKEKRHRVYAVPTKAQYEIKFPRVTGYSQSIRNRVTVDWDSVSSLTLDPSKIPPEVEVKATIPNNQGRHSLLGPGRIERVDLSPYRHGQRFQELVFDMAAALTRDYASQPSCEVPPHILFPQLKRIVERYLREFVRPVQPAETIDAFLSPYYGWIIERLVSVIQGDKSKGESAEVPVYESNRGPGSTADVDFMTSREPREVVKCHLSGVTFDTKRWEQSAAYFIDTNEHVAAFVRNSGLGFAIPYLHNGQMHDYLPDFIIRLAGQADRHLILETKGFDPVAEIKREAAQRWVGAVNSDGAFGHWQFAMVRRVEDVTGAIRQAAGAQ